MSTLECDPGCEEKQQQQPQLLSELRGRILSKLDVSPKHESKLNEDKFLLRYLLKYDWDLDRSERAIVNYMKLNEEFDQPASRERLYPKEVLDLCHGLIGGMDYDERIVLIIPHLGKDSKKIMDEHDEETIELLTECILKSVFVCQTLLDERKLESAVFLADLGSLKNAQYFHRKTMEYVLYTLKDIVRHLPTLASKVVIVNAPWPFKGFLKFLMTFIKVPVEVVVYRSTDLDWRERLREHFPVHALPPEFGGTMKKPINVARLRDSVYKSTK